MHEIDFIAAEQYGWIFNSALIPQHFDLTLFIST